MNLRIRAWMLTPLVIASPLGAQQPAVQFIHHNIDVNSGVHDGTPDAPHRLAFQTIVQYPGAPWLRVKFGEFNLGAASYVILRPIADPQQEGRDVHQRFDAPFSELIVKLIRRRANRVVLVVDR